MISKIFIKNFRSIASQEIDANWITTFVGENDAGKSNVLRALNLFFNGQTDLGVPFDKQRDFSNHYRVGRGKANQTEITLHIAVPSNYRSHGHDTIMWQKVWREDGFYQRLERQTFVGGEPFSSKSKLPTYLNRMRFTYVPAIKDKAFFTDLQGKIYEVLESVAAKKMRDSATVFEGQIAQELAALLEAIRQILPGETSMKMPENLRSIFENMEMSADGIPLSRRGDGIKIRHIPQMLKFIADRLDEDATGYGKIGYTHLWGFEEPENNVELTACFGMANQFVEFVQDKDNIQLFLTTHSPVFYKISAPDDDEEYPDDNWVERYFLEKGEKGTVFAAMNDGEVDGAMGMLPLVAPYLDEAKAKYDAVAREREAHRERNDQLPVLFVEGMSDTATLRAAFEAFAPDALSRFRIVDGGPGAGGVNALADRALAWALEMRCRPPEQRVSALALFDNDGAGKEALDWLNGQIDNLHIKARHFSFTRKLLPLTARDQSLRQRHILVPGDLEAMLGDALWELADDKGWLEDADCSQYLSHPMLRKIAAGGANPLAALEGAERRRVHRSFSMNGKRAMSNHIAALTLADKQTHLDPFKPVVNLIVGSLLPDL